MANADDDLVISFLKKTQPNLQNAFDPIVLAIHSEFLSAGCQLRAISEEADEQDLASLPGRWNSTDGIYCFIYRKDNQKIIFKCLIMDDMISCNASIEANNAIVSLDLSPSEHINGENLNDYGQVYKQLQALRNSIKENIINPLGLAAQPEQPQQQQNNDRQRNPLRVDPVDPLRVGPPRRPNPYGGDFDGDVNPFGPGPGGIMGPGIGNPGNLMGPGHGAFGPRGIRNPRAPGGLRQPPGARFDPTNPFGGPGAMGPGGPNPDHFQPPGRPGRGGRGGFGGGFGGPMI